MKIQIYLLNRTYIAQDQKTGLIAYGGTEKDAYEKLVTLVQDYWEQRKVVVPVKKEETK